MINYGFEDPTSSMATAERADLMEALLRGELSREDYVTCLLLKNNYDEKSKRNDCCRTGASNDSPAY